MNWIPNWLSRRRRYRNLSESIREHLEEKIEELMEEGMPRREAEQAARRSFGNVALIEQRSREVWQWPAVEALAADAKIALRRLARSKGFAATVILTLAIGIGANTAVFSVLNCVVFKPLPYPEAEQLVAVWLQAPGAAGLTSFTGGLRLSPSMYLTFAEHSRVFQSIGVWISGTANVTGLAQPEEAHATYISDGMLQTLNVPATAGRWILTADQAPRTHRVVMLSYGYWRRRFGGDRSVIGRNIEVDSEAREIVGVMPRGFEVMNQSFDLLIPLGFDPRHQILAGFGYNGIARLKPGVSIGEANADIGRMLNIWMDSWTNGDGGNPHFYETWKIAGAIRPMKEEVIGNVGSALWVVMSTIGLVMLIACTNVANMLLVRADSRQQELAVRAALGAGRGRIARELLVESLLLGGIGGLGGVAVAYGGLRLLAAIGPANLPRLSEISLSGESIAFTVALSILSGLFLGSIVALKYASVGAGAALRGSGRTSSAGRERHRARNTLVVAQVAMALVLLVCAGLMIRTFAALRNVEPGFSDPDHLQTMRISIPQQLIPDAQATTHVENEIADKLAAVPGVRSVGFARSVAMDGIEPAWNNIFIEGRTVRPGEAPMRLFNYVSPGYFQTMGTHLVAGRDYTWTDIYGLRPVGIVSENLAREFWGSAAAAIGKRFRILPTQPWREVIGVAEDVRQNGVDEEAPATVYWPVLIANPFVPGQFDAMRAVTFVAHSDRARTQSLLGEMQQAVWQVNGNLPVASLRTMGEIESRSMARTSFTLTMLGIAGAMALLLGVLGIYGVISYAVSQRTREIGIRLALGAQRNALRWMFVRSALVLTGTGMVIGLAAALALSRTMKAVLFGISPLDPLTYVSVPLVLAACAALAAYLPARRAARVEPMAALREE